MDNQQLSQLMLAFYNDTDEMILFINDDNEIIFMNDAAKALLSHHDNLEHITKSICNVCLGYTSEKALMTCLDCFMKNNTKNNTFQMFIKDEAGTPVPYSASYVYLSEHHIKVLHLQNISPQIKTQESLHQKTVTQRILQAQENERKRISRELHDSLVQELLHVMVDLRLTKYKKNEELEKHLQLIEGSMSRLMDDVRNMSLELRPASLDDLGIEAALKSHIKQLQKNYGIEVHLDSNLNERRFSNEIETVVYRVTQEAILNALKYANVDDVDIFIQYSEQELLVEVSDQGVGFTHEDAPLGTGLGLFGMRERAEIVGGDVQINSVKNKGTIVTLTIPLS